MEESKTVIAGCGAEVKARGIKSHQRGCTTCKDLAAAAHDGVTQEPEKPYVHEHEGMSVAEKLAAAGGGADGEPARPGTDKPFMKTMGNDANEKDPDRAAPPPEELDRISQRIGTAIYNGGSTNRFDWCREFEGGPRHTFTRRYQDPRTDIRVLVDIYPKRLKSIVKEIELKRKLIAAHNDTVSRAEQFGYIVVIRDEPMPSQEEFDVARDRGCVEIGPARRLSNVA